MWEQRAPETHLVDERLNLVPKAVLAAGGALDGRKGLVDAVGGGAADVGEQVGEVLGGLELDLALDLGDDGVGGHGEAAHACVLRCCCRWFGAKTGVVVAGGLTPDGALIGDGRGVHCFTCASADCWRGFHTLRLHSAGVVKIPGFTSC